MSTTSSARPEAPARLLWLAKGLGHGGAEHLLLSLLDDIDRTRFDVEVAYLLPWKDALVPELESRGVPTHCLSNGRVLDPRWILRLRALVRDRDYDLVHTHMPVPAVGARVAGLGVPLVHTEHNLWSRYRLPTRVANAMTYTRNRRVIAVSDAVASSIRPLPGLRTRWPSVEAIVHGVDPARARHGAEARAAARRTLGISPDAMVAGTVGHFTPKKDHQNLLEAFAQVAAGHDDAVVVLVGGGPLEEKTRAAAAALGLADRAVFAGVRSDVMDLLPAFDVFVLSSRHEGLPIALLEAMASRVPVVATEVGGIPEVVEHGRTGLLVPSGDANALAAAMAKVLDDPSAGAALADAAGVEVERHTTSAAAARIAAIYEAALA